ncbi:MAG: Holliday junction resolvase RuvX [Clostridia bacterium]|nr:Holliday junction resolvase RuvX [Clostridia bacterium]
MLRAGSIWFGTILNTPAVNLPGTRTAIAARPAGTAITEFQKAAADPHPDRRQPLFSPRKSERKATGKRKESRRMDERVLGLDIGDVRIGTAVSDPGRTIATPVDVIRRVGWGPDVRKIAELCRRFDTREIVSGLPLNMDGSEGFQAGKVRALCAQLEKAGFRVSFQDERLSTVAAEEALLEDNRPREERKQMVDKVAAALILQEWLDRQAHRK